MLELGISTLNKAELLIEVANPSHPFGHSHIFYQVCIRSTLSNWIVHTIRFGSFMCKSCCGSSMLACFYLSSSTLIEVKMLLTRSSCCFFFFLSHLLLTVF